MHSYDSEVDIPQVKTWDVNLLLGVPQFSCTGLQKPMGPLI